MTDIAEYRARRAAASSEAGSTPSDAFDAAPAPADPSIGNFVARAQRKGRLGTLQLLQVQMRNMDAVLDRIEKRQLETKAALDKLDR